MKILLFIAFVIVGTSPIYSRPSARWWDDDSVELYGAYMDDYDNNMSAGSDEQNDLAIALHNGFEKYWFKPLKQLYVEEKDSTRVMDTSSEEMPRAKRKEFVFKQGKYDADEYVFKDKDAISNDEVNINFLDSQNEDNFKNPNGNLYDLTTKSLKAGDLKVMANEKISRVNEPRNSHNYFAYRLTDNVKEDTTNKEVTDGIDNRDDASIYLDLGKDDEHKEFVFTKDEQKELDHKYVNKDYDDLPTLDLPSHDYSPPMMKQFSASDWNDVKEFIFMEDKQKESDESDGKDILSSDRKDVNKDYDYISTRNKQFYSIGYPPILQPFATSDWNNGKEFLFIEDKNALQDEENAQKEHDEENEKEEDKEVVEDEEDDVDNEEDEDSIEDEDDEEENENKPDEKEDTETYEDKGAKEVTENEENIEYKKPGISDVGTTHLDLSKYLPRSSINNPLDIHNNYGELLSQFAVSLSNTQLLFYEHQTNIQDFLMGQEHLNDALKELNSKKEMMFDKLLSTTNERSDYNGQLYSDIEMEMTEMLQTVDQIKTRIIQMHQIEQKHNYHMLLNAMLFELNGKIK